MLFELTIIRMFHHRNFLLSVHFVLHMYFILYLSVSIKINEAIETISS